MIWKVDVKGEDYILVDAVSIAGARIMAAQLGYVPVFAARTSEITKHVYTAVYNTNPSDPKLLDLRNAR